MSGCKYDAVLSYHTNPLTCGVAKFNQQLAQRLGVPCLHLYSTPARAVAYPLLSVKWSEMPVPPPYSLSPWRHYDVLSHDRPHEQPQRSWVTQAGRVFYADEIGCPSTISGNHTRGTYRVLTFGMAHKRVLKNYAFLKEFLEVAHPDYTLSLSTAVHEGSPWDTAMQDSEASLRALFGERFRFLGFLADDAIAAELAACDAVAMFFTPALRKNNTSYWAAVAAGKPVFTNRDDWSPQPFDPPVTWETVLEALGA